MVAIFAGLFAFAGVVAAGGTVVRSIDEVLLVVWLVAALGLAAAYGLAREAAEKRREGAVTDELASVANLQFPSTATVSGPHRIDRCSRSP